MHISFAFSVSATEFKYHDYATLRRDVATLAYALRHRFNIAPGDHVVGYVPNVYRTAVALLATAAVGAVWSSTSVDFGPSGVLDRFSQVGMVKQGPMRARYKLGYSVI